MTLTLSYYRFQSLLMFTSSYNLGLLLFLTGSEHQITIKLFTEIKHNLTVPLAPRLTMTSDEAGINLELKQIWTFVFFFLRF